MIVAWPDQVRAEMVEPQNTANREADKFAAIGDDLSAFRLRVFGRINDIENALIVLSKQIEEGDRASL